MNNLSIHIVEKYNILKEILHNRRGKIWYLKARKNPSGLSNDAEHAAGLQSSSSAWGPGDRLRAPCRVQGQISGGVQPPEVWVFTIFKALK